MIKNRIKEYRAKYDMKQEDLAKLVGVRRETIGNITKNAGLKAAKDLKAALPCADKVFL